MPTGQDISHLWKFSNSLLVSEVCADNIVEKDRWTLVIKEPSSENITSSKVLLSMKLMSLDC